MVSDLFHLLENMLGLGSQASQLGILQMSMRAVVIFLATLVLVRLGEKRFLGKNAAFDVILGVILGSVVSRGINGSAAFLPTIAAGFVLVSLHWLLAVLGFYSRPFGDLIKGRPRLLVKDGVTDGEALQKSHVSEDDLLEALRVEGMVAQVDQVYEARLEPSGNISVIKAKNEPKILEIRVEAGVQVMRIQVE